MIYTYDTLLVYVLSGIFTVLAIVFQHSILLHVICHPPDKLTLTENVQTVVHRSLRHHDQLLRLNYVVLRDAHA